MGALEQKLPLCITDLARGSQMEDASFCRAWQEGVEQDGSSTEFLYMDEVGTKLEDGQGYLRLGAGHTRILKNMLRARVGKDRSLFLQGSEAAAVFCPGEETGLEEEDGLFSITLTAAALEELCDALKPHAGVCRLAALPLTVELVPTKIKDRDGNVLEIIE